MRYCLDVYRGNGTIPEENAYWDAVRQLHAAGLSDPIQDHPLCGKAFSLFFESDRELTLDSLEQRFHCLGLIALTRLPERKSA